VTKGTQEIDAHARCRRRAQRRELRGMRWSAGGCAGPGLPPRTRNRAKQRRGRSLWSGGGGSARPVRPHAMASRFGPPERDAMPVARDRASSGATPAHRPQEGPVWSWASSAGDTDDVSATGGADDVRPPGGSDPRTTIGRPARWCGSALRSPRASAPVGGPRARRTPGRWGGCLASCHRSGHRSAVDAVTRGTAPKHGIGGPASGRCFAGSGRGHLHAARACPATTGHTSSAHSVTTASTLRRVDRIHRLACAGR